MQSDPSHISELHLRESTGPLVRLVFAIAGVAIIVTTLIELGRALWPLGWWSPFFAVIVVGACGIGAALIVASIFGDDSVWTLRDAVLRIERRSLWRAKTEFIRAADIAAMSVRETIWDNGPNTYRVAIRLRAGPTLLTPPIASDAEAAELLRQIDSLLRSRP